MAIVFPASPSVNETFTEGSITYKCVGTDPIKWIGLGTTPADRLVEGSNSLEINASNELVWTGSDVGIGTNAPGSDGGTTLEIYNATTPTLKLNDGDEYKALLQLRGNDLEIRGSNGVMEFYTGSADGASSTERLRITSTGSAQFTGENSPSGRNTRISQYGSLLVATTDDIITSARCSIDAGNGNIATEGALTAGGQVTAGTTFSIANVSGSISGSGGGQDYIGLRHGSTFGLMLKTFGTNVGNVGIGETSPADRLVVQKTNASGDVGVRIKNDTLTDGDATNPTTASLYLNTSTGDFNTFYIQARRNDGATHFGYSDPRDANHSPNMVITSGGEVGINVTSPSDRLHVKGAIFQEGNSDGAVIKSIVMIASFPAGTHNIFTCTATGVDNSAVATMEYVSLFSYSGNNHCAGIKLASTRRSVNNTAWENLPNVNAAGPNGSDTNIQPNLFFQNGVLMVTVPSSAQVTATVRITTRSFTLVRNYSAG